MGAILLGAIPSKRVHRYRNSEGDLEVSGFLQAYLPVFSILALVSIQLVV